MFLKNVGLYTYIYLHNKLLTFLTEEGYAFVMLILPNGHNIFLASKLIISPPPPFLSFCVWLFSGFVFPISLSLIVCAAGRILHDLPPLCLSSLYIFSYPTLCCNNINYFQFHAILLFGSMSPSMYHSLSLESCPCHSLPTEFLFIWVKYLHLHLYLLGTY